MDGLDALEAQTGRRPPAGLAALSDDQLQDLAEAVREARGRQVAELDEAATHALGHIPRLLRGPVRKLFR
jgi:hypothetical protein